jgi:hypothetical protein
VVDRWRQSAHEGDSESRALAIPSPRRGSFFLHGPAVAARDQAAAAGPASCCLE